MSVRKKKLFLIDGNSFCYRAYYAIRNLSTSKGEPTNAVYGFISMLNKLIGEQKPDLIGVAFDLKGPTFRHEKFAGYKIHRKPMPDDLIGQLPVIKEVVSAYRIPIFEVQGYEADDILATIAHKAEKAGMETYIVTGDKDAMQMVNSNIKVFNPHKDGVIFDEDMVRAKYGIGPSQITDLLAIMGDTSDNIPGITGIGRKGAQELINEFGDIDTMFKNIEKIKSKSKKRLVQEQKESAVMSKELATLDSNVPINVNINSMKINTPDQKRLVELFKRLEFRSLLKEFVPTEKFKSEYVLIDDPKDFKSLVNRLKEAGKFVFDFETTHEDPMLAKPVGVSFSYEDNRAYYVPFNLNNGINARRFRELTCEIFEDRNIRKIGQNIKYEYIMLRKMGIHMKGVFFDTMVASYVLDPSRQGHNLGDMSISYLNHKMTPITELIGKGKGRITMDRVDVTKVKDYSCEDSDVTRRLSRIFTKELKEKELEDLFFDIEMPLVEVLASMEMEGVKLDVSYLKRLSKEMEKRLSSYEKRIYDMAAEEFNINSPKQLARILFEKKHMPVIKKTKTGASTDEEVLRNLAIKYDLPGQILKYRGYSKLKSTYVDALPDMINPDTGKVHTSFNQAVAQTGRLSSSGPNLQNIPIKTEEGKKIRKAFIPSSGNRMLLTADYSQIELRILAHLSGDENLLKAFNGDRDIHRFTASKIYDIDEDDVTDEMRSHAKTINFGIVYGMGAFKLSKGLGINIDEAKKFIDNYFDRYAGVKIYLEDKLRDARKRKYVSTIMQRRRYIPEIVSENARIRSFAERIAINAPIQGSAADIIKMAMIRIFSKTDRMKSKMVLQVHDELVFDAEKNELSELAGIVKDAMENVVRLKVPVKVNLESGENWLDLEAFVI